MRAALIAVLVTLTGCEKADEPPTPTATPAAAVPAATAPAVTRVGLPAARTAPQAPKKTPPPPAEGRALDGLKLTLPEGWTGAQDDAGQWNFELASSGVTARLNRAPAGVPGTASGYLEYKIDWCWDPGTSADLVANESRPGGFAATMLVRDAEDPDHPRLAYHAVWEVDGVRLRCEADRVGDEATRDQIAALCDSARW
jgi:hypothetical protein